MTKEECQGYFIVYKGEDINNPEVRYCTVTMDTDRREKLFYLKLNDVLVMLLKDYIGKVLLVAMGFSSH